MPIYDFGRLLRCAEYPVSDMVEGRFSVTGVSYVHCGQGGSFPPFALAKVSKTRFGTSVQQVTQNESEGGWQA
jgi:hypothetical protein